jgi:RNA polymerase sigma factor (sigma-70 family)
VEEALRAARASVSLNQTVGVDDEGELGDLLPDPSAPDPFDEVRRSVVSDEVRTALHRLSQRDRTVLELRFGFHGEQLTFEEIGRELNLTRERVRHVVNDALRRMEKALAQAA